VRFGPGEVLQCDNDVEADNSSGQQQRSVFLIAQGEVDVVMDASASTMSPAGSPAKRFVTSKQRQPFDYSSDDEFVASTSLGRHAYCYACGIRCCSPDLGLVFLALLAAPLLPALT
jgi:hypothetical protein